MKTLTSAACLARYGEPLPANEGKYMRLWDVPADINAAIPVLPNKIYCNKDMIAPLEKAFRFLIARGYAVELTEWNGCFNVRKMRGYSTASLHSWGAAIDVNASRNALGKEPTLSPGFVRCFLDAGFEWGGLWTRKDGMHFQLTA